jgi:hypothetical protein
MSIKLRKQKDYVQILRNAITRETLSYKYYCEIEDTKDEKLYNMIIQHINDWKYLIEKFVNNPNYLQTITDSTEKVSVEHKILIAEIGISYLIF